MPHTARITDTEWEVMKILWAKSPQTANEVVDALQVVDSSWHPKTVRTLLNRLVQKRALRFQKEGRSYLYRPAVKEEECVDSAGDSFLQRVFGGSLRPMLAHYVERGKLTPAEIAELKRILDQVES